MEEKAINNDVIYYIKEIWIDDYKTLTQGIEYRNNMRDKLNARNLLNPNLTTLLRTQYYDKDHIEIKEA